MIWIYILTKYVVFKFIGFHFFFDIPSIDANALGHSILKSSPDSCSLASFLRIARAPIDLHGSNHKVKTLKKSFHIFFNMLKKKYKYLLKAYKWKLMTYTINSLLKARNLLPCKIVRSENITLIFLTVLGNMKL